ncbi:hypothetical protein GLOIN_2v1770820 [Rhizophagus irregularis DAOM 181602=DAOM 197198]|nr:hypothetical protein GLOIN_2v1770820 [Rhizophagus irregularis DAOM 181602=DAOM 197198]
MPSIEVALDKKGGRNCEEEEVYITNIFFPPENEIWECHANNTNIAEAAHAQANREGKQLKLLTAIMRGRCLDERIFKIAETHDRKSSNTRYKQSRKARRKRSKTKAATSRNIKTKKSRVDVIEINSDQENEDQDIILNIEIEESKNAIN